MNLTRKQLLVAGIAVSVVFMYVALGFTGVRVIAGLFLIMLPAYFILDTFELGLEEKIVATMFFSIGGYSTLVYYSGLVIGSFRAAMAITFLILIVAALVVRKTRKKGKKKE
ncbi:hypothetical protein JXA85_04760 [Candidatus Woesearchaeota archaeon]|nr:hypothetical protein [Candidatus Woesearchaeota archaeon]